MSGAARTAIRRPVRTYRAAFSGLPRDVWLLCAVLLVNRSGSMVLPFLGLFLAEARGFSVAEAGRLLSLWGVGSIVGSLTGGWLSDRIGALRTQLASLCAGGVAFLAFLGIESNSALGLGIFAVSVITESFRPAAMAAIVERTPAGLHARAFALLRLAANLGMAVGPAMGGLLAGYDYQWLFVGDALTCWLAAVVLAAKLGVAGPARRAPQAPAAGRADSPWRDGPFLLLLGFVLVVASVLFQAFSTLPLFLRRYYGYREGTIGLVLGFNALIIVLFEMVLIHWMQHRDRLVVCGIGAVLLCGGQALMPLDSSGAFIAFTVAIWTVGEMFLLPMTNALAAERAEGRSSGRYMGLYAMAFSIAFVVAPAAGTWVLDHFGPRALWYGVGLIGPLLFVGALALRPALRRRGLRGA